LKRKDYIEWIISHIMLDKEQDSPTVSLTDEDWQNLYDIALEEGVAPYLYYCLKKSTSNLNIPQQTKQKFVIASQNVLARNTVLFHELGKILRLFSENGIPVIVLKGAYLSEIVYPHNGLRPMGDIDLLAKINDLSKVREILLEKGFTQTTHLSLQEQCDKAKHLAPFTNAMGCMIEVHWTISDPRLHHFKIDINQLWQGAKSVTIANVKVLTLSPEHTILYLCIHTSKQHMFILWIKSFCDIANVIQHYQAEIEWDKFLRFALIWKVDRSVYVTLKFVKELFGVKVPIKVLDKLRPSDLNLQVVSCINEIIFSERKVVPKLDQNLANVLGNKGLGVFGIQEIIKTIFPPKSIIAIRYNISQHSPTVYLYYFVRLINILLRYSPSAFRLLGYENKIHSSFEQATQKKMLRNWMKSSNDQNSCGN
jgi:hypothetical protein